MPRSRRRIQPAPPEGAQPVGSWVLLVVAAAVVGAAAGGLGAAFRRTLEAANGWRGDLVSWADGAGAAGAFGTVAACAVGVALAVWIVRRLSPQAAGSGIPNVEGVLLHRSGPPGLRVLPVKFVGGALAIGSGLALGREGPTVQMGGAIGWAVGGLSRRLPEPDLLLAAGAGAGLAAAFDAPLAGAVFVVEELVHRFSTRLLAASIVSSVAGIAVLRAWLGSTPDLPVPDVGPQLSGALVAFGLLGLVAGIVGVAFNRTLLRTLGLFASVHRISPTALAALVGAAVGLVAWLVPKAVGGGYPLAQEALTGNPAVGGLAVLLVGRFVLTLASYGTGAAGGLFAPLLVIGSELGRLVGEAAHAVAPGAVPDPGALAVAGMAAVFVASVRAPITGVVLILEMTGAFPLVLPLLASVALAYVVPAVVRDAPVYDALRDRDERREATAVPATPGVPPSAVAGRQDPGTAAARDDGPPQR